MKTVFKYGTGWDIPEGAIYLFSREEYLTGPKVLVWHYYEVEQ